MVFIDKSDLDNGIISITSLDGFTFVSQRIDEEESTSSDAVLIVIRLEK